MKYHNLFLSKTRKDVAKASSAAVVIGALRVNIRFENAKIDSYRPLYRITDIKLLRAQVNEHRISNAHKT